jgi:hypothetical protein
MSDRALVRALALVTLALLIAASATGSAIPGWAAIATFAAALVAYVRWRLGRRRRMF